MFFSTSPKSLYFFTSLPAVCLLRFPCVKKNDKNQLPPSRPCKIGLGRIRELINQVPVALIGAVSNDLNDIEIDPPKDE